MFASVRSKTKPLATKRSERAMNGAGAGSSTAGQLRPVDCGRPSFASTHPAMIRMHRNALFAVLLRKPWWVSAAIGMAIGLLAAALVPEDWRGAALLTGLPFFVIAGMALVKGFKVPGAAEVERTAKAVRALAWPAFAGQLQQAFERDGWSVQRIDAASHDFVLERKGRRMLVAARRWKSAHLGLEPLRALQAAREAADGADALYVSLGEPSAAARRFAAAQRIAVWEAAERAQGLRGRGRA